MNFKIGQKVVCINAEAANNIHPSCKNPPIGLVIQNEIYTILFIDYDFEIPCLVFEEIGGHTYFEHHDFRPLDYSFVDKLLESLKQEKHESA